MGVRHDDDNYLKEPWILKKGKESLLLLRQITIIEVTSIFKR